MVTYCVEVVVPSVRGIAVGESDPYKETFSVSSDTPEGRDRIIARVTAAFPLATFKKYTVTEGA